MVSKGGITIDPAAPSPPAPVAGTAGPDATTLTSGALGADVSTPGSVNIAGVVQTGGTDGVRHINAGGDIFVAGTLRTADLGGSRQGLSLAAPNGTVFINGVVDTSGSSGAGQAGGALTITARQVIVTGKILTLGGDGATAGDAGAIAVTATGGVSCSGLVDASGGNARGGSAVSGARGGALQVTAGGDVALGGTVRVRGGAAAETAGADARGGDAGPLAIDGDGAVTLSGTIDARGGFATAATSGGAVAGGAAGSLKIGEATPPTAIAVLVPLLTNGGAGAASGGAGGPVVLEAHGGDLRLGGDLDTTGGSGASPGAGGDITATPGPEDAAANVDIAGKIVASGGAVPSGASGNGAAGGTIKIVFLAHDGSMVLEPGSQVHTDGGGSGGTGTAGAGGMAYLFTVDGNASVHGSISARGGAAPDPGGTGGEGGLVYIFTANGHDRQSGVLIIETDGLIDASGGPGTVGGSARNNAGAGAAKFPVVQDNEFDVEQIAVLINSDGVHGSDRGWIDNRGQIIARGGAANGGGGDVIFHGKRQDGNETPLPGNVVNTGDGTGVNGVFAGE
jgi:hypothetical protein